MEVGIKDFFWIFIHATNFDFEYLHNLAELLQKNVKKISYNLSNKQLH